MKIETLLDEATAAPKGSLDEYRVSTELMITLMQSRAELVALVKAARRHCIKSMLPDDHYLREALAALEKHADWREAG